MVPPILACFFHDLSSQIYLKLTEVDPPKAIKFMWRIIAEMLFNDIEYDEAALFVFAKSLDDIRKRTEIQCPKYNPQN